MHTSKSCIPSKEFSIPEIYKLSQKHNQQWGISGYEAPAKYLDHIKLADQKLHFKYVTKELPRPKPASVNMAAKRKGFLDDVQKNEQYKPEPWKYDLRQKWLKGYQGSVLKEKVGKNKQKLKFKWLGLPTEKQEIEEVQKIERKKVNTEANKHTFIDEIILQNTKKEYPHPGPGNYFLDNKSAKRFFEEHEELVLRKNNEDKEGQTDTMPFFKKKGKARFQIFAF